MDRRKFVKSVGVSSAGLAFAGCSGDAGAGEETGTGTATGTDAGGEGTTEETGTSEPTETETETGTGTGSGELQLEQRQGQAPPGIRVENLQIQQTDSGATVTGTITNAGDATYEQLEVQVTLLDNTDDVLGQYFDNTEGEQIVPLEPQEQFEFSIDFPSADLGNAVGYRIDVDTDIDQGFGVDWGTETSGSLSSLLR